jgi:hypothetical protein
MALSQGLQGLGESIDNFKQLGAVIKANTVFQKISTAAQWLWNAAMAANPIGAIIAGIVALVAAGVALTKFFMSNAEAAKINTATVEKNRIALENQTKSLEKNAVAFDKKQSQELAMAKASGLNADAIRKLELKLIDEKIAFEKSQRAIAENTYQKNLNTLASLKAAGADADLIKKQSEIANESIKQYNKQNQDVQKAFDEKKDIQNRHLVEVKSSEVNSSKEIAQKRKEAAEKAKADAIQAEKDKKDALERIRQGEIDTEAERRAEELRQVQKQYADLILEAEKYYGKNSEKVLSLKEAQRTKEKELTDKFALEDKEKRLAAEEKKKADDAKIKEDEAKIAEEAKRIAAEEKAYKEEQYRSTYDNLQNILSVGGGKLNKVSKALAIADVVRTATKSVSETVSSIGIANAKAVAASPTTGGMPFVAINTLKGALTIGSTIASSIKAIQAIKGDSKSVGGGGSSPSGGGDGGGAPSTPAPQFNVVGNSGVNQIAQTLGAQQPVQAYVVASNVTTQQSLDRNIVANASLG